MSETQQITEDDLFDVFMFGMIVGFLIGFVTVIWSTGL